MSDTRWLTLEEAGRSFGIGYEQLWDYIMGRVPRGRRLPVYRLAGGTDLRVQLDDILALLEPVRDPQELAELEKQAPRPKVPGHLF